MGAVVLLFSAHACSSASNGGVVQRDGVSVELDGELHQVQQRTDEVCVTAPSLAGAICMADPTTAPGSPLDARLDKRPGDPGSNLLFVLFRDPTEPHDAQGLAITRLPGELSVGLRHLNEDSACFGFVGEDGQDGVLSVTLTEKDDPSHLDARAQC